MFWKMGKLLLEERCRRICEIMFSRDSRSVEALANALIQVCPLSSANELIQACP